MWICLEIVVSHEAEKVIQMNYCSAAGRAKHRSHKAEPQNKASASRLTVTRAPELPGTRQRPLAAGCLVHANPSSPEARL